MMLQEEQKQSDVCGSNLAVAMQWTDPLKKKEQFN